MLGRFESDKKHKLDSYVLILVDPLGKVVLEQIPKSPDSIGDIRRAIASVIKSVSEDRA